MAAASFSTPAKTATNVEECDTPVAKPPKKTKRDMKMLVSPRQKMICEVKHTPAKSPERIVGNL
jgi:hypothetical protein